MKNKFILYIINDDPSCANLENYLGMCDLSPIELVTKNITNDLVQKQRLENGIQIRINGEDQQATITGYPALEIVDKATLLPVLLLSGTESIIDTLSQFGVQKKPDPKATE